MRNSITLSVDGPSDSVSIDGNEARRRLRGPRICIKAFLRDLDGDRIAFDRKGDFIGDFILLGLAIATLSFDFLAGDKSRKVLA
jgi:hypothetical protein